LELQTLQAEQGDLEVIMSDESEPTLEVYDNEGEDTVLIIS
jgi:DNA/RNA endonuclease YhcR with UshA esterase domain